MKIEDKLDKIDQYCRKQMDCNKCPMGECFLKVREEADRLSAKLDEMVSKI